MTLFRGNQSGGPNFDQELTWSQMLDFLDTHVTGQGKHYRVHTFHESGQLGTDYLTDPDPNFGYTTFHATNNPSQENDPEIDLTVEAHPGGGSLKFTVPGLSGANAGGEWFINLSEDLNTRWGVNKNIAIRFARVVDSNMRTIEFQGPGGTPQSGGIKTVIIGHQDEANADDAGGNAAPSSRNMKLVLESIFQHRADKLYRYHPDSQEDTLITQDTSGFQWQNEDEFPACLYPDPDGSTASDDSGCRMWAAADQVEIITILIYTGTHIDSTTYDSPVFANSTVKAYSQIPGAARVCIQDYGPSRPGYVPLQARTDWEYLKLWFGPYMTDKLNTQNHATAHMWIADIIMAEIEDLPRAADETTVLSAEAASLSSGDWGSITVNGLTQALVTRGDTDTILSFARNSVWNPNQKRIYFYGATHGNEGLKRMLRYVDSTNTWESDGTDGSPEADGEGNPSHGYNHLAQRPSDGQQFIRHYSSENVSQRAPGGSWSALPDLPGDLFIDWVSANSLIWHPGVNSGSGGLVFMSYSVYVLNAAMTTWTQTATGLTDQQDNHNAAVLNRTDNLVYFGGGNGGNKFYRVNNDGTVTARADIPFSTGQSGADGQGALFAGGAGGVFAVNTAGSVREFNTGTNAWSAEITTLPFSAAEDVYFHTSIDTYGVVAFTWISSGLTPSTTMHIWKR